MSIIGVRRLVALGGSLGLVVALGGVRLADADTASAPSSVVSVSPYRILDTRNGVGTGGAVGKVGAGQTITLASAVSAPCPPGPPAWCST